MKTFVAAYCKIIDCDLLEVEYLLCSLDLTTALYGIAHRQRPHGGLRVMQRASRRLQWFHALCMHIP